MRCPRLPLSAYWTHVRRVAVMLAAAVPVGTWFMACSPTRPGGGQSTAAPPGADHSVKPPTETRSYGRPASAGDGDSIRALMTRFGNATRAADAAAAAAAYAEDAEWTNAFGRVKRDRAELEAFLRDQLFGGQTGTPGRVVLDRVISFRYIGSDAAVLHSYNESDGQLSPKGTPMGYRRTHHHFVLGRLPEGWRIVHHVVMDQRDTIP